MLPGADILAVDAHTGVGIVVLIPALLIERVVLAYVHKLAVNAEVLALVIALVGRRVPGTVEAESVATTFFRVVILVTAQGSRGGEDSGSEEGEGEEGEGEEGGREAAHGDGVIIIVGFGG